MAIRGVDPDPAQMTFDGYAVESYSATLSALNLIGLKEPVHYGAFYRVTVLAYGDGTVYRGDPVKGGGPAAKGTLKSWECESIEEIPAPSLPGLELLEARRS